MPCVYAERRIAAAVRTASAKNGSSIAEEDVSLSRSLCLHTQYPPSFSLSVTFRSPLFTTLKQPASTAGRK